WPGTSRITLQTSRDRRHPCAIFATVRPLRQRAGSDELPRNSMASQETFHRAARFNWQRRFTSKSPLNKTNVRGPRLVSGPRFYQNYSMRHRVNVIAGAALSFLSSLTPYAQGAGGITIFGNVSLPDGTRAQRVIVKIESHTGLQRETYTDDLGRYSFMGM